MEVRQMSERPDAPGPSGGPSAPDRNRLGLGPRDRESSNTGSIADTSYHAHGSDPYTTGEPRKEFAADPAGGSTPADEDVPSSDAP
jgi:hypothetical protein